MSNKKKSRLLTDGELAGVAQHFKLLGEPMRLKILQAVCRAPRTVGDIVSATGATQANVSKHLALLAASGIVLGAAYMLWMYQRVFFGGITHEENKTLKDVNLREQWTLIPLIVLCFWIGLYPKPFFRILEPSLNRVVQAVDPDYLNRPVAQLAAPLPTGSGQEH